MWNGLQLSESIYKWTKNDICVFFFIFSFLDPKQSPTASTRGTDVARVDQSEATKSLSSHPLALPRAHSNVSPHCRPPLTPLPLQSTLQRRLEQAVDALSPGNAAIARGCAPTPLQLRDPPLVTAKGRSGTQSYTI